MISTEFAANEQWDDAWLSASLLLQSWRWYSGPEQHTMRDELAKMFSTTGENVQLFLSGRAALYHIVTSLPIEKGSEVIVTGFTCEAVVVPLITAGLTPIYADIDTETFSMTSEAVKKCITAKTAAIILQHSFGIPPHRKEILALAKKHNLLVIEDIAHGWERGVFESDSYETIKLLSFGRSKSFSSVFGGAVITANKDVKKTLNDVRLKLHYPSAGTMFRLLIYKPAVMKIKTAYGFGKVGKALHKISNMLGLLVPEISSREKRGEYDVFFDKKYPNALAILGLHQLKKRAQVQKHRKIIYDVYKRELHITTSKGLTLSRVPVLVTNKDEVLEETKKYNIYLGRWYDQPVAPKEIPLERVAYKKGSCPVAEDVCNHIINLPTHISVKEAEDIAQIIKPHLSNR